MEAVRHVLYEYVVHLLGVLGRVVVVRFDERRLWIVVSVWSRRSSRHRGCLVQFFCVGTLATSWGSSCGAVFSVCTARDSLPSRMRLLRAVSNQVEAGVLSSTTLGIFGLGGCCVTLGGG